MRDATAIGLAHALAAAGTVDEVQDAIQHLLPSLLDAAVASIGIVDADAGELRLRPSGAVSPEELAVYENVPLDSPVPIVEVVRTGQILVLADHDAWRTHAPDAMVDDIVATGLVTTVFVPLVDSSDAVVAALGVSWDREIEVDDFALTTLGTIAELCEHALERAWTTDLAAQRATDLARLAEQLAHAMTVEAAFEVVTTMGQAPVGALATSIGLIDHDAGVLRTHHGQTVDDDVSRRFSDPSLDAQLAFTDAARVGEAVYVEDYDAYLALYPESAPATAALGLGARAAVPIRRSSGEMMGSMVHAWAAPRVFDELLTSTITTIAEMAGQAIERAQLLERIRRDSARNEALAGLAELLATAGTSDEVAGVIALNAASVIGADSTSVAILRPGAAVLQVLHFPTVDAVVQERLATIALDAEMPHADVVREGGMVVFEDFDALAARYPNLVDELRSDSCQACAVVALPATAGQPLGALGLAWTGPTRIDDNTRATVSAVARLCGQALERAQLSDAEHRLVSALRDSVLTPLPPIDGVATASRYLPSARRIGMGGDWYQGVALDEHRYALILGDVAGHGVTAVSEMAQLQAVIGALVRLGTTPGEVFQQATALLRGGENAVTATALLVIIDTGSSTINYVAAGHPPPLLRTPQGATVVLSDGRQPLLGVPMQGTPDVGTHAFPPGSILVAYTDGLVERRGDPMDHSIDRLRGHLQATTATDADSVADALIAASLAGHEPDDDVAIVVVRRQD